MSDVVPDHLRPALGRIRETAAALDTRVQRARELPMPQAPAVDPKAMAAYARNPDAPPQLKAVADAVAKGRTTWSDVLAGRANDLPEVAALRAASLEKLGQELDKQLAGETGPETGPDTADPQRPPAAQPEPRATSGPARPRSNGDDEDFSEIDFMVRGFQ